MSYLYVEHCIVDQAGKAVELLNKEGRVMVPVASLSLLMLGPGTSVTHAAVRVLAENGCLAIWCGEEGVRFYAQGMGETRKGYHLMKQAELSSDPEKRYEVVKRMYRYRFKDDLDAGLSLEQVRGLEGVRVRQAYADASRQYGVPWHGRFYDRQRWQAGDPINRALSTASACLNGICHAGIVSGGYSPGLGFIHSGRQLSFVYDIADLYKTEITIPLAFRLVAESEQDLETRVRRACRDAFREARLLQRILPDIDHLLGVEADEEGPLEDVDEDLGLPGPLWTDSARVVDGGKNYGRDGAGGGTPFPAG